MVSIATILSAFLFAWIRRWRCTVPTVTAFTASQPATTRMNLGRPACETSQPNRLTTVTTIIPSQNFRLCDRLLNNIQFGHHNSNLTGC
jgi:hypothetical protein